MKTQLPIRSFIYILFLVGLPVIVSAQSGKVQANGIQIAYESLGSANKETVLLISGTNAQLSMWPASFCNHLVKNGYRVIRFDHRDIGLSTKFEKAGAPDWAAIAKAIQENTTPPLPYTLDDMADDAVGLLDALGIKKAHIVGASMGGMIAQRVAYNHPEHTLSLASIMAGGGDKKFPLVAKPDAISKIPPPGDPKDTAAYINREVKSMTILAGSVFVPDQKKLLKYVKNDVYRSYYPDGLVRQGAASLVGFYSGRQQQLKTIKVPVVVIHGSEDPLVVPEAGKDVASYIPRAHFELIKGMGHDLPEPAMKTIVNLIIKNARKAKSD
ncbi:MAG: alpha/beta hydrolase [Dyadobacter sp.]|uniref:alpha/beta fold hydrolase n=1 Tax=Dyadobacter sp. TaxID=1914288 RepID=UPI00326310AB